MYMNWKDKECRLSDAEYREMMLSEYVRKSLNPRIHSDCEETARLSGEFSDENKFLVHKGVACWHLSADNKDEFRPVSMKVAYFARFLGYKVIISRHRKALDDYNAQIITAYRQQNKFRPISDEERFEMAAAFGKDATVVNVLTGEVVQHGCH